MNINLSQGYNIDNYTAIASMRLCYFFKLMASHISGSIYFSRFDNSLNCNMAIVLLLINQTSHITPRQRPAVQIDF